MNLIIASDHFYQGGVGVNCNRVGERGSLVNIAGDFCRILLNPLSITVSRVEVGEDLETIAVCFRGGENICGERSLLQS